jgi:hypothetical protein
MKGAYQGSPAGVPKLVVMLRNPTNRLYSSFLQYDHYRERWVCLQEVGWWVLVW